MFQDEELGIAKVWTLTQYAISLCLLLVVKLAVLLCVANFLRPLSVSKNKSEWLLLRAFTVLDLSTYLTTDRKKQIVLVTIPVCRARHIARTVGALPC